MELITTLHGQSVEENSVNRAIETHLSRPSFDRHRFGSRGILGYDVVEASLHESRSTSNPTL